MTVQFDVNRFPGMRDDMTLTVDFWGWKDESGSESGGRTPTEQNSGAAPSHSLDSDSSLGPPPPLPASLPPPPSGRRSESPAVDSMYLSTHQGDDSADEASEIIDEDDGGYRMLQQGAPPPMRAKSAERDVKEKPEYDERRAKSVERDSGISDTSFLTPVAPKRRPKSGRPMPGSLESIPDSGMESMSQDDFPRSMRNRIQDLDRKFQVLQHTDNTLWSPRIKTRIPPGLL